jgi:SAM-dependent methyltransferase
MANYDEIADFGLLYDSVPLYAARRDIGFYVEEGRRAAGRILEVGCGTGRILVPLARAGASITGIDPSREMLARCQAKLDAEPADVRARTSLVSADIRSLDLGDRFALAIAPFRVLQHLTTVDDQLAALGIIARHLAPGGVLIFDVLNPNFRALVGADGTEHEDTPVQHLPDGRMLRRTARVAGVRWIDQVSEIELIYYVWSGSSGSPDRYVFSFDMRWYLQAELRHLLARAGFRVRDVYGDFDRSPLRDDSPEQIMCTEVVS